MKLYLSSNKIPDPKAFSEFVGKDLADIKFGLILNSKDYKSAEERESRRAETNEYFSSLGLQVTDIDLRDYYDKDGVDEILKGYDVLWFNGGNTYMLRWALAKSKSEKSIKEILNNGVVYGGDSAGSIMAGPTLKYFDKADSPEVVDEVMYDGLGLTTFVVVPHWGSVEYDSALKYAKDNLEKDSYKTLLLTDDEFVLIENDEVVEQ